MEVWPSVRLDGTSGSASSAGTVGVEAGQGFVAEFVEISAVNRRANIVQQLHEEMLVVDRRQCETVEFAGTQRMIHVSARIMRACVAIAALFKWAKIMLELRALDVVTSAARENRAISAATRRCDAIERVSTILDACENIVDCGDAEHVARSAFRHRIANPGASVADNALLDRTSNTDAVEIQRSDLFGRMPAQILIIRALYHAIQRLIRLADALSLLCSATQRCAQR